MSNFEKRFAFGYLYSQKTVNFLERPLQTYTKNFLHQLQLMTSPGEIPFLVPLDGDGAPIMSAIPSVPVITPVAPGTIGALLAPSIVKTPTSFACEIKSEPIRSVPATFVDVKVDRVKKDIVVTPVKEKAVIDNAEVVKNNGFEKLIPAKNVPRLSVVYGAKAMANVINNATNGVTVERSLSIGDGVKYDKNNPFNPSAMVCRYQDHEFMLVDYMGVMTCASCRDDHANIWKWFHFMMVAYGRGITMVDTLRIAHMVYVNVVARCVHVHQEPGGVVRAPPARPEMRYVTFGDERFSVPEARFQQGLVDPYQLFKEANSEN